MQISKRKNLDKASADLSCRLCFRRTTTTLPFMKLRPACRRTTSHSLSPTLASITSRLDAVELKLQACERDLFLPVRPTSFKRNTRLPLDISRTRQEEPTKPSTASTAPLPLPRLAPPPLPRRASFAEQPRDSTNVPLPPPPSMPTQSSSTIEPSSISALVAPYKGPSRICPPGKPGSEKGITIRTFISSPSSVGGKKPDLR